MIELYFLSYNTFLILEHFINKNPPLLLKNENDIIGYNISKLEIGDHIIIQRRIENSNIGYYHHGIITQTYPKIRIAHAHKHKYNNNFLKTLFEDKKIKFTETSIEDFIGNFKNKKIEKVIYNSKNDYICRSYKYQKINKEKIIQNVKILINTKKYNLKKFNCEHFSLLTTTGKYKSTQIKSIKKWFNKYKLFIKLPNL